MKAGNRRGPRRIYYGEPMAGAKENIPAMQESMAERRSRFERATAPHIDAVYRVALRMTHAPDRADDAVQETYLRAWKYFDTFEEGKNGKVWLFAILRNAIFEAARKRKREVRAASLDEVGADNVVSPGLRGLGPSERMKEQDVLDAIQRLPEEFRIVALMAIVEELKYKEIAEALEIPIGTVMSRLFRARQLLRWHLKGYMDEDTTGEAKDAEVA
jgi:RNA polymerase sigma-70 factor, ECF subfamily